jgi:hypothetical protein
MVDLNLPQYPTLQKVDEAMEAEQLKEKRRGYLGMSSIGHACDRKLWNDFRFVKRNVFDAATLRKFEDGHKSEDIMADRLRMVDGIQLHTLNDNGEQFGFQDVKGHFRGHMDGAIKGILEAPRTWHVWEHKACDRVVKNKLEKAVATQGEKDALKHWNETYYAQAVLYMYYSEMKRHYLTVSCSGTRTHISVRTEANKSYAKRLMHRAADIITTDQPPLKVSDDPDYFVCKNFGCTYRDICHSDELPDVNCRTCVHSKPVDNGKWHCGFYDEEIKPDLQIAGCDEHVYIPALLSSFADMIGADELINAVQYHNRINDQTFWNGSQQSSYTSKELHGAATKEMIGDKFTDLLKVGTQGRIVPTNHSGDVH